MFPATINKPKDNDWKKIPINHTKVKNITLCPQNDSYEMGKPSTQYL